MGQVALVLLVVWVLLVSVVPGYRHYRRHGRMPIHARDRAGSAQWWSRVIGAAGIVSAVAAAVADVAGLGPFGLLDNDAVHYLGIVVVALGIVATLAGQSAMGDAWRGDVDPDVRTALVTAGPFRFVRNPILTSTLLTAAGVALVVPNVFAVLMLVAIALSQQIQVRLVEEPDLLRAHGDAYREYAARTGRFLPGIGRLPAADDGRRRRPADEAATRPQPHRNQDGSAPPPTRPGLGT